MPTDALKPEQVLRILEVTDSFNLHREAVYIPLITEDQGSVTLLPDNRLKIVGPKKDRLTTGLVSYAFNYRRWTSLS